MEEEVHFMIADKNETVIVEFINNKLKLIKNEKIMTNFYLSTPLTLHSHGIERYNILKKNYNISKNEDGMFKLMKKVFHSKLYNSNPFWYSEYYYGNLTKNTPKTKFNDIIKKEKDKYKNRKRNRETWFTTHTAVYNIKNKTLSLLVQEDDSKKYEFDLK